MTARPLKSQKATILKPARFRSGGASPKRSDYAAKPQKLVAYYLNPACEHDWVKLDPELQTLEAEGKVIWKCRSCSEITNTYDWQTP